MTPSEKALLESWYIELARSRAPGATPEEIEKKLDSIGEGLFTRLGLRMHLTRTLPFRRWILAACILLATGGIGMLYYLRETQRAGKDELNTTVSLASGVSPGEEKAHLILPDGRSIILNDVSDGEVAREGNVSVFKKGTGEVVYRSGDEMPADADRLTYHTVSTPKAGQYKVQLPDGSQVWLNAASSIRFPVVFPGEGRSVEVTGEVYFEVAKLVGNGKRVPFKVKAGRQTIEVLGTHFNVSCYAEDKTIKTTLLEGSIKLNIADQDRKKGVLLKPGQQSELIVANDSSKPSELEVREVDAESVVAWKDGYFQFENADLPELMGQISRWYDVEIVYEGPVKKHEFVAQIKRNTRLEHLLKILEEGDVKFRVEGRKIIVTDQL